MGLPRKKKTWADQIKGCLVALKPKTRLHYAGYAVLLMLILWIYVKIVYKHGTLFPLFVMLFTLPFPGRAWDSFPPDDFRPQFRVVFSLTSTPDRLPELHPTLQSLKQQTLPPDAIYLNVPQGSMRRKAERVYPPVDVEYFRSEFGPIVHLSIVQDLGPLTKLIHALDAETELGHTNTLVVTVDDDKIYPPELLMSLAWEHILNPTTAFSACGWGIMPVPRPKGLASVYVPYFMRPTGRYVDVLQGVCGSAFSVDMFQHLETLRNIPDECITVDDVWIAGILQVVENKNRALVSKRLDPTNRNIKGDTTALSLINRVEPTHIRCIDWIEKNLGPWKRVRYFSDEDLQR